MQKLWIYLILIFLVFACKEAPKEQTDTETEQELSFFENIPNTIEINQEATVVLADWEEFKAFQDSFELMFRAVNKEDLVLAIDDLLAKEVVLRKSSYPEQFKKPQITSRQKVLRTFLLKIKGGLDESTPVNDAIKQLVISRNAFRNQFNVIVNNKLDADLILNEN